MVRYCTLEEEAASERAKRGVMRQALAAEDTSVNASLYILLRAVDRFEATCGRFPGTLDGCAMPHTAMRPSTGRLQHNSETAGQQSIPPWRKYYSSGLRCSSRADSSSVLRQSCSQGTLAVSQFHQAHGEIGMPLPQAVHSCHGLRNAQAAGGGHGSAEAAHGQRRS